MTVHIQRMLFVIKGLLGLFGTKAKDPKDPGRAPDKGEVGGSSPPRPTILPNSHFRFINRSSV